MTLPTITEDKDTIVALKQLEQIYSKPLVYYYEGKPYRVLHEGKVKATSIMAKCLSLIDGKPVSEEELSVGSIQLRKVNNNSLWIDVVVYEPLYAECDIRVCVKEKEDFYNNYKPTV